MNSIRRVSNVLETFSTFDAFKYNLSCRPRSVASYGICRDLFAIGVRPTRIYDVGANQGQFAVAAHWWFPKASIVSFEPAPRAFEILKCNTRKYSTIDCVQSAVGDVSGELEFFESEYSHASSALPPTAEQLELRAEVAKTRQITVPVISLDDYDRLQPPASGERLLKLDIQGYEKSALLGASKFLGTIDFVLMECSYRRLYEGEALFEDIWEMMRDRGFSILAPVGQLRDDKDVVIQNDWLWRKAR